MSAVSDGSRLIIRGHPSPEETAAVVAAVGRPADDGAAATTPRRAWQEAARREAVGERIFRSPGDLHLV